MTAWYLYPITHGYETQYEGPGTDTPHYADDIGVPFHTPLTAILPGTIERADYQPWGGEIFIKPDNTAYPEYYYYHTDLNEVSAGQHVGSGQEIALSGGQTSGGLHPVTDGESTGAHLHMGWKTKYVTPPETGVTIPYGPDPSNLLAMAKGGGGQPMTNVPSNIYSAVEPYAQQYHVPDPIWETVAYMESNFNPQAINTSSGNPAVGLFQLLENAGQGAGYSTAQLDDPATNARIGVQAIGTTWQNLGPTFDPNSLQWWEEFAAQSGHPGGAPGQQYTDQVAQTMMADYQKFAGSSNSTLADTSGQNCQAPPWYQPWGWPSYFACQAQNAAAGSIQSIASAESQWIGSTIGPFVLRVGVGLTGIILIVLGIKDIADGLKNPPELIASGNDQAQRNRSQKGGGKRESRKEKRAEKKEEKKEKREEKHPAKEEEPKKEEASKGTAGEEAGEAGEAGGGASTAEVAAVAA